MLGIEATTIRASKLKAGDYLINESAEIIKIAPTSDQWMPAEAIDVRLDNGQTVTLMPHDPVRVTGDLRELAARS
jgi:hypothetical protein